MGRGDQGEVRRPADWDLADIWTQEDLARVLRQLQSRHARAQNFGKKLTIRELAKKTGYSTGSVGAYLDGTTLPPIERLDVLVQVLGATPDEQRTFATKRDLIEESGRKPDAAPRSSPRQLPGANRNFTGRRAELAELSALLEQRSHGQQVAVVSAIEGTAGVGKTALAIYWGHQMAERFPDGQLYVNLRDKDTAQAVGGFLRSLGVPPPPPGTVISTAEQVDLYRSMLGGRRVLVILDNVLSAAQARPLLPGSPTCVTVVTSRSQLTGLIADGAHSLVLDVLNPDQARELLTRYLGAERVTQEPRHTQELIDLCARLPLALTVVAARACLRKTASLRDFCAELREKGIAALSTGDSATDVETVFSWSYDHLSDVAKRMFRLLGLHPGQDISLLAAASLAGVGVDGAAAALAELTGTHLIEEDGRHRYAFHDLLRDYAHKLSHRVDDDADRRIAQHRLLDHYLHTGHTAAGRLNPRQLDLPAPQSGVTPANLDDADQATDWFETEVQVLAAVTSFAADNGFDAHAWQIPWTLADFLDRQGRWDIMVTTHLVGVDAAQRAGDRMGEARSRGNLGRAYRRLGRYDEAVDNDQLVLGLFEQLGNVVGQSLAHRSIATVFELKHNYPQALDHAEAAVRLAADDVGRAAALNQVGWYHALLGQPDKTLSCCGEALALYQDVDRAAGDAHGQAAALDSLGFAHHQLGDHAAAVKCYRKALPFFAAAHDRYKQAETLIRLSAAYRAAGDVTTADTVLHQARNLLGQVQHPDPETTIRETLLSLGSAPRSTSESAVRGGVPQS